MKQLSSLKAVIILAFGLLLSACGYHLQGTGVTGLDGVSLALVSDNPYGDFEKKFTRRLRASGVELKQANDNSDAVLWQLELLSVKSTEQGVSRDETGRASEAVLITDLVFRLTKAGQDNSEEKPQKIQESASYVFDYRDPVTKKNQQREAQRWLNQKLADRLLRRLERQIQVL